MAVVLSFVILKNAATSQGRGQRYSWYHLVLTISPPNQFGANYPQISVNGLYPEHLTTTNCASGIRLPSHVQEAYPKEARTRWPPLSGRSVLSTPLVPGLFILLNITIHAHST